MACMRSDFLLAAILAVANIQVAHADHLPDNMLALGKPEKQLAGINLVSTNLDDVIRMFGPPTRILKVPNNPHWTGYTWKLSNGALEIGVAHSSSGSQIHDVYIEGKLTGQAGSTGQGLKIGDTIQDLKRLYGNHFELSPINKNALEKREEFTGVQTNYEYQVATIQWKAEEFTLSIGFNDTGKISAIWLILPECYPDGCE
jgi:hypothetical protein